MTIERAKQLAKQWANGYVCSLREGEAEEYHKLCFSALRAQQEKPFGGWIDVVDVIEREPAVDAVEVVRCKECKWSHTPYTDGFEKIFPGGAFSCRMGRGLNQDPFGERLPNDDSIVSGDDFCSCGERKEGFEDG